MKKLWLGIPAAAALVLAGPVLADGAEAAKKNGCMACHAVDKKVVGPGFNEVAGKVDAAGVMEAIKSGSRGKWGKVPMPPQGRVSAEDAQAIADWIVTLK